MSNEHQTRLWQMRPDALQYIHAKQAAKLSGLDPDTLDDMWTEYFADAIGVDAEPIEYTDDGIAIVSVVGPLYKRKSPFVSNYKAIAEALDELGLDRHAVAAHEHELLAFRCSCLDDSRG